MPTLLDERRLIIEFSDLYRRRPLRRPLVPSERYEGAHQSDILAYVARKAGHLKPGERLEEEIPERMFMGIMFEEMYFSLVPDVEWQPGEVVEDEIAVNADGIGRIGVEDKDTSADREPEGQMETYIEETKCTEKKIRTGEEMLEEFMWMHQGRSYCYAYGKQYVDPIRLVRWTIWYYRGDWRGSGPVCMQYLVRFSDKEVEQTWAMLKKNKDKAMAELEASKPTAVATN